MKRRFFGRFSPSVGGTGATITGMVSALAYAGLELDEAAKNSAIANRMAGKLAQPSPATKVWQIVSQLPAAFEQMKIMC